MATQVTTEKGTEQSSSTSSTSAVYEGFRAVAERAASRGQRPLPIIVGEKKPATKWKGSVIDTDTTEQWKSHSQEWIEECAAKFPQAAACVIAKPDEFCFIDEDESEQFRKGYEAFAGESFPRTFTSESRPNHRQSHWLQTDATRRLGNVPQSNLVIVSFRQNNLYVLSEGSPHPSGTFYRIVDDSPVVPMPAKLVAFIESLRAKNKDKAEPAKTAVAADDAYKASIDITPDGPPIPLKTHDDTLFRIARELFRRNPDFTIDEVKTRLIEICEARAEGYGSDYVSMCEKCAVSAYNYGTGRPTTVTLDGKPQDGTAATLISDKAPIPDAVPVSTSGAPASAPPASSPSASEQEDPLETLESKPSQDYLELLRKSKLAKPGESWLALHAQAPHEMQACDSEWIVDRVIRRRGLSIFCAEQGSFKTILAQFLVQSLLANRTGESKFLGRPVQTVFGDDPRPLKIYFIDLDSPKGLTKTNCLCVGITAALNGGSFKILGAYDDEPITTLDDPRLIESAKRERAFFIVDTLSKVFESMNENDPSEANYIMSKAQRLAYASEGVLINHHDSKDGKHGYRGSTPIVNVPDMSFQLTRTKGTDRVALKEIRFKDVQSYEIHAELNFSGLGSNGLVGQYTYRVISDSLTPCITPDERDIAREVKQHSKDADKIAQARQVIEKNAADGKEPLSRRGLAVLAGITSVRDQERILCASTPESPRPWIVKAEGHGGRQWFSFHPLASPVKQPVETQVEATDEVEAEKLLF